MENTALDFVEFASGCSGRFFRTAYLLTGNWHLAEDLVQETLGKVYRSWRRVSRMEHPAAYAETVLVRTFLSFRRRRSADERPTAELPDQPDSTDGMPGSELRLTLMDGLARLPARDRAVLVLRYWEDRSVEESAAALQISAGAVRTRSMRALERLRKILGDQFPELAAH